MLSSLRILGRNHSVSTERCPGKQSFTSQFLYFASRPWPRDTQGLTDWCILNACAPTTMGVSGHLAKVAEVLSFRDHPWSYTSIYTSYTFQYTFIICHIELEHPCTCWFYSCLASWLWFLQLYDCFRCRCISPSPPLAEVTTGSSYLAAISDISTKLWGVLVIMGDFHRAFIVLQGIASSLMTCWLFLMYYCILQYYVNTFWLIRLLHRACFPRSWPLPCNGTAWHTASATALTLFEKSNSTINEP